MTGTKVAGGIAVISVVLALAVGSGSNPGLVIDSVVQFSDLDGSASDRDGVADGTLTVKRLLVKRHGVLLIDVSDARIVADRNVQLSRDGAIKASSSLQEAPALTIQAGRKIELKNNAAIDMDGAGGGGVVILCSSRDLRVRNRARITASSADGDGGSILLVSERNIDIQWTHAVIKANGANGGDVTLASCSHSNTAIHIKRARIEAKGSDGIGGTIEMEARCGGVKIERIHHHHGGHSARINATGTEADGSITITAAKNVRPNPPNTAPPALVMTQTPSNEPCDCPERPDALDDLAVTDEDTAVTIDVLANDTDPDGNIAPSSVSVVSGPSHGTVLVNAVNGAITYTPTANFNGSDSFSYEVCDDGPPILCDTASVAITVHPINDPPVAENDTAVTDEDTSVTIAVLANDNDLDGHLDPSSVVVTTGPGSGSVTINPANGEITYAPNLNFNGQDSFIYQVCDDGTPLPSLCDSATVTISVNAVNDAPVATDDLVTTSEDTAVAIDVLANDVDLDGNLNPAAVVVVAGPDHGNVSINQSTGEVTYTPEADFNGTDEFTYEVCDDGTPLPALCDTAVVSITIGAVNDAPVAGDDAAVTDEDTSVSVDVLANDSDIDGSLDPSSVAVTSGPSDGSVSINTITGEITYLPDSHFNGMDSFTYEVCDTGTPLPGQCDSASVSITVNAVNDPPLAVDDDMEMTNEDTAVVIDVLANDSDVDGNLDPGSVVIIVEPDHGTALVNAATGEVEYVPDPDFSGIDMFTYEVCDDGTPLPSECDAAVVTVTVKAVNDVPMANNDTAVTNEDVSVTIDVLANDDDLDGNLDPSTVTVASGPCHGSASVDSLTGEITYTPPPDFNGTDVFVYEVCDEGVPAPVECDTATVTITVNAVNDGPVANDDIATVDEDGCLTIDVLSNDSDVDGTLVAASVIVTVDPGQGTVSVNNLTGEITYKPNADFNGSDGFTYEVCDDGTPLPSLCASADVSITVNAINDPPVAMDDANVETAPMTPVVVDVLANDSDVDGNLVSGSVVVVSGPDNGGTSVDSGTGEITYTPDAGFAGIDTFTYEICDDGTPLPSECDTALVTVMVFGPPTAVDDHFATLSNTTFGPGPSVLSNDTVNGATISAVNGDPGSVGSPTSTTAGGTVTLNTDGTFTYNPPADQALFDTFTYTLSNPADTDTATVTIQVGEAPIAADDGYSAIGNVQIDVSAAGGVFGNDVVNFATLSVPASSENGGDVTGHADGSFSYNPPPGFEGSDTFDYTLSNGLGNSIGTVTVTVEGMIWFIDNSVSGGDGRLTSAFGSLAAFDAVNGGGNQSDPEEGDTIFVASGAGNYGGSVTLEDNQRLIGGGASVSLESITGLILPPFSAALPATGGASPNLASADGNTINLAVNNLVRGLDVGDTPNGGFGISDGGASVGLLDILEVSVSGSGGALNLANGGTANLVAFDELSSTDASAQGINLVNVNGTITVAAGSILDASGAAVRIDGGNLTLAYPGSISKTNAGRLIEIVNTVTGAIDFNGNVTGTSPDCTGVRVADSSGSVNFNGALDLGTNASRLAHDGITLSDNAGLVSFADIAVFTAGARGLVAENSSTVTVTTGSLDSGNATAVDVDNSDLNITLTDVSSSGGSLPGIDLNITTGIFVVSGDGATAGPGDLDDNNGSGGTIADKSGNGVILHDAVGVSLNYMNFDNCSDHGIRGTAMTNFTMSRCNLTDSSNQPEEASILIEDLQGACAITNTLMDNSFNDHIRVVNSNGVLDLLNVQACSFIGNPVSGQGNDGILYVGNSGSNATVVIQGSEFLNSDGDHVHITMHGDSTADVTIGGPSTADGNTMNADGTVDVLGSGITLSTGDAFAGRLDYLIQNNDIQNARSFAVNVSLGSSLSTSVKEGTVSDNTIGTVGVPFSGGMGLRFNANTAGTTSAVIENNTIQEFSGDFGLHFKTNDGSAGMIASVSGNTIGNPSDPDALSAIRLDIGTVSGDTSALCVDLQGNTFDVPNAPANWVNDLTLRQRNNGTLSLPGYVGGATDLAAIEAFIQGNNVGNPTVSGTFTGSPGVDGNACP
ncbi:MAG: tandem-95 repeat protein [Phycisphaerales bacterium]|nr:tandem-95 repeat protein [Phycisphaerales bacterium]